MLFRIYWHVTANLSTLYHNSYLTFIILFNFATRWALLGVISFFLRICKNHSEYGTWNCTEVFSRQIIAVGLWQQWFTATVSHKISHVAAYSTCIENNFSHRVRCTAAVAMHFRWPLASSHGLPLSPAYHFLRYLFRSHARLRLRFPGNNILRRGTPPEWNGFCRWLGRLFVWETMLDMDAFNRLVL